MEGNGEKSDQGESILRSKGVKITRSRHADVGSNIASIRRAGPCAALREGVRTCRHHGSPREAGAEAASHGIEEGRAKSSFSRSLIHMQTAQALLVALTGTDARP